MKKNKDTDNLNKIYQYTNVLLALIDVLQLENRDKKEIRVELKKSIDILQIKLTNLKND